MKDLNFKKRSYGVMKVYAQSKLCNILFSLELAEKMRGTGENKYWYWRKVLNNLLYEFPGQQVVSL